MPLKPGYSRATFNANVAEMLAGGRARNVAIYVAGSLARESYFARYPAGAVPYWLAFPKAARLADRYDREGHPASHTPTQANPRPDPSALAQAKRLYRGFTGRAPRTLKNLEVLALPKAGLAIGRIFGIMYSVDATGERFHHEFKGKARPTLIVGSDGKQVFMRGGAYTFTKRGFVDKK